MNERLDNAGDDDAWVLDLLKQDALARSVQADMQFVDQVMQTLGAGPSFDRMRLAHMALAGGGALVTALAIGIQWPGLMELMTKDASGGALAADVLSGLAPFALLAGLSWLAYRSGADGGERAFALPG